MVNKVLIKHLIILCLFLMPWTGNAQFPSEVWHQGKVVLVNSDTIRASVKYDLDRDIIQINNNQGTEAYTARKVLYFSFVDEVSQHYRQFYALPFRITSEYKTPIFFEVLLEGKMTLLAREFVTVKTVNYGNSAFFERNYSQQVLVFRYYFLDNRGNIIRFHNNKKKLLQIFKRKESEIKQYTKRNRLRFDNKSDMIQLTEYYNSLITPQNNN